VKEEQEATEVLNEVLAMKLQLTSYLEMVKTEERNAQQTNAQKVQKRLSVFTNLPQKRTRIVSQSDINLGSSASSGWRPKSPYGIIPIEMLLNRDVDEQDPLSRFVS